MGRLLLIREGPETDVTIFVPHDEVGVIGVDVETDRSGGVALGLQGLAIVDVGDAHCFVLGD